MSARTRRFSAYGGKAAMAANADLFEGTPWAVNLGGKRPGSQPLRVLYPADLNEMFSATEDLWLRIKRHPALRIHVLKDSSSGTHVVLVRAVAKLDAQGLSLKLKAQDRNRYAWRPHRSTTVADQTQAHNLVSAIEHVGNAVVLELTPLKRLVRQAGLGVEWQLNGMLARVQTEAIAQGSGSSECQFQAASGDNMAALWQESMRSLKIEIDALAA